MYSTMRKIITCIRPAGTRQDKARHCKCMTYGVERGTCVESHQLKRELACYLGQVVKVAMARSHHNEDNGIFL